jgi:ATP-binding cassette subfamily F protein uup
VTILDVQHLQKAFGARQILSDVTVSIRRGERVGLVGLNGSGKSTFAKILAGIEGADGGEMALRRGARVAYLAQTPTFDPQRTALDEVLPALGAEDGEYRAHAVLTNLGILDPSRLLGTMSGGEQRRVALARLLVSQPDLAILDEPTNHLDIDTITWLEEHLASDFPGALVLITHDRYVLDHVASRTWEISRGVLYSYDGGYSTYLEAKATREAQEARTESNRQNFLRREIEWLRRRPKARTTKQKARIDRAEAIKAIKAPEKERIAELQLDSVRTGKTILEMRGVEIGFGDRTLIRGLDLTLTHGQRIGIVGPNGAGKTTLLRTILGENAPLAGTVNLGKNVAFAYLSQMRDGLEHNKSVYDNVADGRSRIEIGGQEIDMRSYLERFLFTGETQRQPVGSLSGGERTRVALAKLLRNAANLLVLDEPTNDLDVASLSALEDMLVEQQGTALIVTHDRWFLDRIATHILAPGKDEHWTLYTGAYAAYLDAKADEKDAATALAAELRAEKSRTSAPPPRKGLSFNERKELDGIGPKIEGADATVKTLEAQLADPDIYKARSAEVPGLVAQLEAARTLSTKLMQRWEELESKQAAP